MREPNYYLKSCFIRRDGTLIAAARKLEIKESRLGRIIHGRVKVKPEEIKRICEHLEKESSELFGG